MKKLKIQVEGNYLIMQDLPHNCIFNKVVTGCGGTTIALTNTENYIIAVPTTELIENKCYPPKDKNGNNTIWEISMKKAGLSPIRNLFGLYGRFTPLLKKELEDYLSRDGVKKIMCTYDKIPALIPLITPTEYRLLVDEYHSLIKIYSYRKDAVDGVLDNFNKFKSFCFMSATPIDAAFKPNVLQDVEEYVADWEKTEPLMIVPYKTNKPYMLAANIIATYQRQGYIEKGTFKSYEAYFFINSVKEIKKILMQTNLTNEDCRIICADEYKNRKTLGKFKISTSTDTPKKFNFITSKSFEGVDFYSETGICYVISNVYNKYTLLSIDMDIPQIAGRIRNIDNPFRNLVVHIFNTRPTDLFDSYEDVKAETEKDFEYAKERAALFNQLSKGAKQQQIQELSKLSYLKYNEDKEEFAINDMAIKIELFNYKLMNYIYNSQKSLVNEYEKAGMQHFKVEWIETDNFIKKAVTKPTFLEVFNEYVSMQYSFDFEARQAIEQEYPFIRDALARLGIEQVKKLRSNKKVIETLNMLKETDSNIDMSILQQLKSLFKIGDFVPAKDLRSIAKQFGLKKATDLSKWLDLREDTKRIEGKVTKGYWISAFSDI